MLQNKGMRVKVYDPLFSYSELVKMGYPAEKTLTRAARDMDCLLIAVGHERFKRLNLRRLKIAMRRPAAVVDLGHVLDCEEVEREGFVYRGLGRGVWTR
jgi:UDP-N-acetyl-D-mannosaminuronate dehydrogenase